MFNLISKLPFDAVPRRSCKSRGAGSLLTQARVRALAAAAQKEKVSQRHSFEAKFNALLKAAEAFAAKYNEGRGEVWPQREAIALQKALADLQGVPELKRHTSTGVLTLLPNG